MGYDADPAQARKKKEARTVDWACYRTAGGLRKFGIFDHNISDEDSSWQCYRLPAVVETAKITYYVSKAFRFWEEHGYIPPPEP